jgi:two-component system response regulator YesN
MIAEDEVIERKSIRFLLSKFFQEKVEIVGDAINGKDALHKALENKPDLILMDISMPEMDGLQASEEIKKHLPECEIIIMTAYSYFDYATKALRIGVNDYLVKPYSNVNFCESLERLIGKVNQKYEETNKWNTLKRKTESLSYLVEREMIMELVHSRNISLTRLNHYKNFLGIQDEKFCCIVFRLEANETFTESILSAVQERFKHHIPHVVGYYFLRELVLLLFSNDLEIRTNLETVGKEIQQDIIQQYKIETLLGKSAVYENLIKMNDSYKEAKKQFYLHSSSMTDEFYFQKPALYKKENILFEKIMSTDVDGAAAVLDDILGEARKKGNINQLKSYAGQLCILMERSVTQFYEGYFKLNEIENVINEVERLSEMKEIQFYLEEMVTDIILSIKEQKTGQHNRMIEKVKAYLDENYMDYGISLNQTADYIGVSPFYLSRSFKKQEGISFKEYLTKMRMDKAIEYLKQKKKNVQEIALEVGFVDPNYFSKAFRRYKGVSPREFMQTMKLK